MERHFPYDIIDKYYPETGSTLRHVFLEHSRQVAGKARQIALNHRELPIDADFVEEAALLHDIGIFMTHAPAIGCMGTEPYICHGYLGAELLRREGLHRHALVCERHTGAGLSLGDILSQNLPVPHRDLLPVTLEEQVVCFADKFFSKTKLGQEKTLAQARRSLEKFGAEGLSRFDKWCEMFL